MSQKQNKKLTRRKTRIEGQIKNVSDKTMVNYKKNKKQPLTHPHRRQAFEQMILEVFWSGTRVQADDPAGHPEQSKSSGGWSWDRTDRNKGEASSWTLSQMLEGKVSSLTPSEMKGIVFNPLGDVGRRGLSASLISMETPGEQDLEDLAE